MRRIITTAGLLAALALSACNSTPITYGYGLSPSEKLASERFGKAVQPQAHGEIVSTCVDDHDGTFRCYAEWRGGNAKGNVVGDEATVDKR